MHHIFSARTYGSGTFFIFLPLPTGFMCGILFILQHACKMSLRTIQSSLLLCKGSYHRWKKERGNKFRNYERNFTVKKSVLCFGVFAVKKLYGKCALWRYCIFCGYEYQKSIRTEKGTDAKWFHGGCRNLYPNVLMTFG